MAIEITARRFECVASEVIERATSLLGADVSITNERGIVIASSQPRTIGLRADACSHAAEGCVRVPLQLDAQLGEIIVDDPSAANGADGGNPRLTQALLDLIITQTTVISRLPNRDELKNTFILNLLLGTVADETDVLREANVLGMDIARSRAVMLIDASDYILRARDSVGAQRRAQQIIASIVKFFTLPNDTICAYIGNGEIVVLKASTTQDLAAWSDGAGDDARAGASWANLSALKRASLAMLARLRRDTGVNITIGIGRYHPGWRGLTMSYRDADLALSLGRRFHGANAVHSLDALGVAAFAGIADERTRVDLARRLLSPLDDEPVLRRTLRAFFADNCCPSSAAQRLGVHRNTLAYRLDKVALLTGLDPRRFDDAVQIRMAMLLCGDDVGEMEDQRCTPSASTPPSMTLPRASSKTAA